MQSSGKNTDAKQPAILILADFSDGSWQAITFAMIFFRTLQTKLFILQTFQNPKFGHFMTRDIIPCLKKITTDELNALKQKLLANFDIQEEQIELLSMQGELVSIIKNKLDVNYKYFIVFSTYNKFSDSGTMHNLCMSKIIKFSNNPIFILPKEFDDTKNNKILFIQQHYKLPTALLKNQILAICKKSNSELEILFLDEKELQKQNGEFENFLKKNYKELKYKISYTKNSSVCKGMKNYLKRNVADLIIIE